MMRVMQERRKEVPHVLIQKWILNNAKEIQTSRSSNKECQWGEDKMGVIKWVQFDSYNDDLNFQINRRNMAFIFQCSIAEVSFLAHQWIWSEWKNSWTYFWKKWVPLQKISKKVLDLIILFRFADFIVSVKFCYLLHIFICTIK